MSFRGFDMSPIVSVCQSTRHFHLDPRWAAAGPLGCREHNEISLCSPILPDFFACQHSVTSVPRFSARPKTRGFSSVIDKHKKYVWTLLRENSILSFIIQKLDGKGDLPLQNLNIKLFSKSRVECSLSILGQEVTTDVWIKQELWRLKITNNNTNKWRLLFGPRYKQKRTKPHQLLPNLIGQFNFSHENGCADFRENFSEFSLWHKKNSIKYAKESAQTFSLKN